MQTSIQIANYYIDNLDAYNKQAAKVGLALSIDDYTSDKTKPLEEEIKGLKIHIENLQAEVQFVTDRLDSRRAISNG